MRNGGMREHPALKQELAARNFCARMLRMLGLHQEPLHSRPGRPGSGLGVTRMDTLRCEHELRREEDAL
jgi:hypothetical protein